MAFNKSKVLENALKSLSQGKVAQAISEYQLILRNDPKDQATLMTVGDLYARQGDMPNAIEYFERLAQVYLNDGFNSKAIAIYKKIAKLAPTELAPLERLADLYVQQGVLSEARPLFLQIAEAHLKANRAPKSVEVLQRLLEVEPENPRVQMRLAEIYNAMGQKKEAAQTYFAYAQRLFDRGESEEAHKLIDRALEAEPNQLSGLFLKAKVLAATQKDNQAIAILENHPESDAGGDVTNLLVDLQIRANQIEGAADRARNQLVRGNSHYGLLLRVAETLINGSQPSEAMPLLRELRDPMIDVGEQDRFLKALMHATERLPNEIEPLEMLADFSRHTSDPFHLTGALTQLVEIHTTSGNLARADELLLELIDRNKGDERLVARLHEIRGGRGESVPDLGSDSSAQAAAVLGEESTPDQPHSEVSVPVMEEPSLDEETQQYIAQALTDVDLFSSYGLVQKATHLLENVLQRAPRHTPTLERLLDLYLGAGNERRTAEIACLLEQIYTERQDQVNLERASELRQKFQQVVGASREELLAAAVVPLAPTAPAPPSIEQPAPEDFALEMEAGELNAEAVNEAASELAEFEIPLTTSDTEVERIEAPEPASHLENIPAASADELDLSDEWAAMVQEVTEPAREAAERSPQPDLSSSEAASDEIVLPVDVGREATTEHEATTEIDMSEIIELEAERMEAPDLVSSESGAPELADGSTIEFDLELAPEPPVKSSLDEITTDEFISQLAAEFEDLEPLQAPPAESNGNGTAPPKATIVSEGASVGSIADDSRTEVPVPLDAIPGGSQVGRPATPVPQSTPDSLNELSAVFQEFRSDMGETTQEDEDLETHYNLGIAYREMGLLDESIGEFQKVANAVQKGKPFDYTLNCFTLLALCFLDKGEPKIAAMWYERSLEVPGLDSEAILALRYDLAVALEMAGESEAALDRFRQVYAVNIDYRDVADHIATLQHQ